MTTTTFSIALRSAGAGAFALVCVACGHNALMPDAAGSDAPIDAPTDAAYGMSMVNVEGDITAVHDPSIVASGSAYYIYSTGEGLPIRMSTDLVHWRMIGSVFATKPAWITTTAANDPNALWAPDVSYFGGQYHLFYAASSFGSNNSCIGHATSPTLDGAVWTDQGKPVICSIPSDDWNALDPAAFVDQDGKIWLAFGSFWSGLKLISLDDTGARQAMRSSRWGRGTRRPTRRPTSSTTATTTTCSSPSTAAASASIAPTRSWSAARATSPARTSIGAAHRCSRMAACSSSRATAAGRAPATTRSCTPRPATTTSITRTTGSPTASQRCGSPR